MLAIALALGASACWGSGDFLGGLTTRRASLWAVVLGSQLVGLAGAAAVITLLGRPWPGLGAMWPVLAGGAAGAVAISTFYRALAIGTMSVVAPISAMSALIPFVVGLAGGERPAAVADRRRGRGRRRRAAGGRRAGAAWRDGGRAGPARRAGGGAGGRARGG